MVFGEAGRSKRKWQVPATCSDLDKSWSQARFGDMQLSVLIGVGRDRVSDSSGPALSSCKGCSGFLAFQRNALCCSQEGAILLVKP